MLSICAAYYSALLLLFVPVIVLYLLFHKVFLPTCLTLLLASFGTYVYVAWTKPILQETGEAQLDVRWLDGVKIDGGSMKGFARTHDDRIIYVIYRFQSEQEKDQFLAQQISNYEMTILGQFVEMIPPSHQYAFQMEKYLRMNGASGHFTVEKMIHIREKKTLYSFFVAQRKRMKQHLQQTFPPSLLTEAEALLIGDRSGMSDEVSSTYRTLGITHLFAISGLHVGLFIFIVRESLTRLRLRKESIDFFLCMFLPLYAVIAGGAPSVWRAVIVTMGILISIRFNLSIRIDRILAISAIGFLWVSPHVLFQPGFQLSYGAAFSLIMSANILATTTSKLKLSFLITTITQVALFPVLLFHFYELSLSSFVVNLVYVPLYSLLILPINLLLLLLTWIAFPIAQMIFFIYEPVRLFIEQATYFLAAIPNQMWTPGKPSMLGILLSVIGIGCFFIYYEKSSKLFPSSLFILLPALFLHVSPYLNKELRVTFLDVGQGDSIVIELPHKKETYVIDTGGLVPFGEKDWRTPEKPFEVGRQIVVPYLKGRGIRKINTLILTHAHADHMGSAHEILEEMLVEEIHIAPNSRQVDEMEQLLAVVHQKSVPMLDKKDGDGWRVGHYAFYYLGPHVHHYLGNDSSLILFMETPGPNFLFTGDAELEAERLFVSAYRGVDFGKVVLKAGHHGSKTSSSKALLEAVKPQVAVISAGRNNRYKHPHAEILNRFEEADIPVYVTAENHSITVHVKGQHWHITTIK